MKIKKALFIMEYDLPEDQEDLQQITGALLDSVLITDANARPKQVHVCIDLTAQKVLSLIKARD